MSDTPRTDAHNWHDGDYDDPLHAFADFAKQLERELNAANSKIERLTAKVAQLYEEAEEQKQRIQSLIEERDRANQLAEWKWNLRDEFQLLLGTDKIEEGIEAVKELKRRIKQLEEAGDRMRLYCADPDYCWAWDKAKEDKL